MKETKNIKYTKFLESCQFRKNIYEDLNLRSKEIIQNLKDLTIKYDTVIRETYEFQSQSNALIDEKTKYERLNSEIKNDLNFYELLYTFTRKLNNPSPNIVKRDSFYKMLAQLDECIQFINDHPQHKEHETYSRRFRQCLTRALTLIRNYVINNLKSIRDEISSKINDTKLGSVTHEALLYTRFGTDSEYLSPVCDELSKRAIHDKEYEGLLNDCYSFYFRIRSKLLQNKISEQIQISNVDQKNKSLVEIIQRSISHFTQIYKDEYELFFKIFTRNNNNQFNFWLQQISEPLYDFLRNHILYEQSISSLCEAATLLEKYYEYEDQLEPMNDSYEEINQEETYNFEKDIDLGEIFQPISQDIQSRLVFRAQAYVNDNIVKYRPTAKSFQIGHRRKSVKPVEEPSADDDETSTIITSLDNKNDDGNENNWYPPLKKGVALLSKIYQLISSTVFDDLAHSIVHDCIISMKQGQQVCELTMGKLDSNLYFLKNLLMLKQQIQNFDIEYVSNETFLDFSGIGDIISKFRNGSSVSNDVGFLELVKEGVPKVVNNMIDARVELQTELRNLVHIFTEDAVNQIIEPVVNYKVETLDKDILKFQENIEESLPRIKKDIDLFIDDQYVVTMLIDGIQELVIQSYENFYNQVVSNQGNVESLIEVDSLIGFIGEVVSELFKAEVEENALSAFKINIENHSDEDLNVSE